MKKMTFNELREALNRGERPRFMVCATERALRDYQNANGQSFGGAEYRGGTFVAVSIDTYDNSVELNTRNSPQADELGDTSNRFFRFEHLMLVADSNGTPSAGGATRMASTQSTLVPSDPRSIKLLQLVTEQLEEQYEANEDYLDDSGDLLKDLLEQAGYDVEIKRTVSLV